MKNNRVVTVLLAVLQITAVGCFFQPICAMAATGPGTENQGEVLRQETVPEHLTDSVLEYDEIAELVHFFNPTIQDMADGTQDSLDDYAAAVTSLEAERDDARRKKKNAKDDQDMDSYADYAAQEATYTMAISSYNKMIERMNSKSSNSTRRQTEQQLTAAVQQQMISYETMRQQAEIQKQAVALYQSQLKQVNIKKQSGQATEADELTAKQQLQNAQASLSSLETTLDTLYNSLCQMTGQTQDGSIVIGSVPEADISRMSEVNLETDLTAAINNNQTVRSDRNSLESNSTSAQINRDRTLQSDEETVRVKVNELYAAVQKTGQNLKAAQLSYEKAQQEWNVAAAKQSVGMMSELDVLQENLGYTQQKAAYSSANMEYLQALNQYDWAVAGVL